MSKLSGYTRPQAQELTSRLLEPRRFIQVVAGARQVGKTTLAGQAARQSGLPTPLCQCGRADFTRRPVD